MLCKLTIEIGFEAITVCFDEGDRGGDVEIVEEVGDMEEDRVAGLPIRHFQHRRICLEVYRRIYLRYAK